MKHTLEAIYTMLYVVAFIALVVILGHRNAEVNRWMYKQELAREIMMADEPEIELDMPIDIARIKR